MTIAAIAAGAAVSIVLGVYGRTHDPTFEAISTFGFDSMIAMKVWFATTVGVLAVGQLVGALWMYGKLPLAAPSWLGTGHRVAGILLVLVSLPVAYHCLWSLGFQTTDTRVVIHSLAGCVAYGAFVTKVFTVRSRATPGWLLPVAGGALFTAFVVVVLTSAGWYLTSIGLPAADAY
ncbi:MAG: DUF6529 family protein [Aeromicrobium sp.]